MKTRIPFGKTAVPKAPVSPNKGIGALSKAMLLVFWSLFCAQAQENDYEYEYDRGGGVTITRYIGAGGAVTIPSTIDGLRVTAITGYRWGGPPLMPYYITIGAFIAGANVTSLEIPPTVITILTHNDDPLHWASGAFEGCTGLTSYNVHTNNPVYSSFDGVLFNKSQTVLVQYPAEKAGNYDVPESVSYILDKAFSHCAALTRVVVPNGVRTIGRQAFSACTNLTSVSIAATVTNVGHEAFGNCSSLAAVVFKGNPPSVTGWPSWLPPAPALFSGATNVTVYYLPGSTGWGPTFYGRPTALWNLEIETGGPSFGVGANGFGFTITGPRHLMVAVEACTDLPNPVWSPVQTLTLTNGSCYFSDPKWRSYSTRFYRLRSP